MENLTINKHIFTNTINLFPKILGHPIGKIKVKLSIYDLSVL